jgi:hypothetical protein
LARIVDRTGADAGALNSYLIDVLIPTDEVDAALTDSDAGVDAVHDRRTAELDDLDCGCEAESDPAG